MPLDVSLALAAHLQQEVTTLARLLKVTRRDSTVLRFTDASKDVVFEGQTYIADPSFTSSAILNAASNTNVSSVTIDAFMSEDGFREGDIRRRLYDGASCDVYVVNYEDPSMGALNKFSGLVGQFKLNDKGRCTFEITSRGRQLNGSLAWEKYSATCRASLGDARCKVDINALKTSITVTAVSGQVVAAAELTQADDHWSKGFIKFTSGANAGVVQPIVSSNQATNSVTMSGQTVSNVEVGDTADVFPGCDKSLATCRDVYNNVANMRAEPFVPSSATIDMEVLAYHSDYFGVFEGPFDTI